MPIGAGIPPGRESGTPHRSGVHPQRMSIDAPQYERVITEQLVQSAKVQCAAVTPVVLIPVAAEHPPSRGLGEVVATQCFVHVGRRCCAGERDAPAAQPKAPQVDVCVAQCRKHARPIGF